MRAGRRACRSDEGAVTVEHGFKACNLEIDTEPDDGGHVQMILPRADAAFEWRETAVAPALVCVPMERVARHLFTTRGFLLGETRIGDAPWEQLAGVLGVPALVRLHQVHGRTVVHAGCAPAEPAPGDIVMAAVDGPAVAVQGADCVPLLIADIRLGVVAAAHAGWRGLAQGVPSETVAALVRTFGSNPHDLVAAIGPSVGACCYEVGPDVREAFEAGGFSSGQVQRWFHPAPVVMEANPPMPGLRPPSAGHAFFDGWACAGEQLTDAGVPADQVLCARVCTASHPEVLCSYRRDRTYAGRIAGAIVPRRSTDVRP